MTDVMTKAEKSLGTLGRAIQKAGGKAVTGWSVAFGELTDLWTWVGALVIALYFGCFAYIVATKRSEVAAIKSSPEENILDYQKVELAN